MAIGALSQGKGAQTSQRRGICPQRKRRASRSPSDLPCISSLVWCHVAWMSSVWRKSTHERGVFLLYCKQLCSLQPAIWTTGDKPILYSCLMLYYKRLDGRCLDGHRRIAVLSEPRRAPRSKTGWLAIGGLWRRLVWTAMRAWCSTMSSPEMAGTRWYSGSVRFTWVSLFELLTKAMRLHQCPRRQK